MKGSLQPKGEVQFVQDDGGGGPPASTTVGPSTGSKGLKVETEREGKTWVSDLARSAGLKDVTETLTFEGGAKKVELSVGVGGKVATKYELGRASSRARRSASPSSGRSSPRRRPARSSCRPAWPARAR